MFRDEQKAAHETLSFLEVDSFEGTHAGDNRPITKIVEGISDIGQTLKHVTDFGAIVTESREDVDRRRAAQFERLQASSTPEVDS